MGKKVADLGLVLGAQGIDYRPQGRVLACGISTLTDCVRASLKLHGASQARLFDYVRQTFVVLLSTAAPASATAFARNHDIQHMGIVLKGRRITMALVQVATGVPLQICPIFGTVIQDSLRDASEGGSSVFRDSTFQDSGLRHCC